MTMVTTRATMSSHFESIDFEWVQMPLDDLLRQFFQVDLDDIASVGWSGGECSVEEMRRGLEGQRMWGFAHGPSRRVYYWHAPDCPRGDLLFMLGHELGHVLQDVPLPVVEDDLVDEVTADRAGMVAVAVAEHLGMLPAERERGGAGAAAPW